MAKITRICPVCQREFLHKSYPSTITKTQPSCSRKCSALLQGGKPVTPIKERFWSKVKILGPDDCWEWQGYIRPDGYGRFRIDDKMVLAHRVAYELAVGPIPEGKALCHKCDNRKCCNGNHHFTGTQLDNMHDRDAKGRGLKGRKAPRTVGTKLNLAKAHEIKELYKTGNYNLGNLAAAYLVSETTIHEVVKGKTWLNA
jgi:hypothetical protein